jgi:hypothetical protein
MGNPSRPCMYGTNLQDVNLKLNPNKCMFSIKNIKFLGQVVWKSIGSATLKVGTHLGMWGSFFHTFLHSQEHEM